MKISELISRLLEIKDRRGDIEVFLEDWAEEYASPVVLTKVDDEPSEQGVLLGRRSFC